MCYIVFFIQAIRSDNFTCIYLHVVIGKAEKDNEYWNTLLLIIDKCSGLLCLDGMDC